MENVKNSDSRLSARENVIDERIDLVPGQNPDQYAQPVNTYTDAVLATDQDDETAMDDSYYTGDFQIELNATPLDVADAVPPGNSNAHHPLATAGAE